MLWLAQQAGKRGSAVWRALGDQGRKRFVDLVRKSKGRPDRNLNQRERDELRSLASKALKGEPSRQPGRSCLASARSRQTLADAR